MNGLPAYPYEDDDARANEADLRRKDESDPQYVDTAHFTCGHCHRLAKFSELTQLSCCCGWDREGYVPKRLSEGERLEHT
jgi:hypothetical protein